MAPRGRKRKAEAAVVAVAEKREKLANGGEGMEEATVVIEHCTSRVYGRNAAALSQALRLEAPELPVKVNPTKPRRGSFEVTLLRPDGSSAELWTGIKKGPPRKLKFPEPQEVVEELKKYLS
uniref:Selenoprotein H n=1 Tax=Gorilla gorilla gorilla TaxID=9595 RepID=G3QGP1_GORGO